MKATTYRGVRWYNSAPTVAGITSGSISRTTGFTRSDGRAVFNVSVAAESTTNTNRKLTIKQGNLIYGSKLMSQAIDAGTSIISVYALTEQTGSRGTIKGHDYVYVAGKKWATQNLAISNSGKGAWKPSGSTVKVPCSLSEENVVVGDYFQWGAYQNYVTVNGDDKGLLIYKSFEITKYDGSDNSFTERKKNSSDADYSFDLSSISPYYSSSSYTRYNNSDKAYRPNLDISDDVARTLWGDTWRMPTLQEFIELCAACFVEWDGTNKGLWFYAPKDAADKGLLKLSESSWKQITETATSYDTTTLTATVGTYTATDALLFFPAAGQGSYGSLRGAGSKGCYWSSTLHSYAVRVDYLIFSSSSVYPQNIDDRCAGYSVRPLSD